MLGTCALGKGFTALPRSSGEKWSISGNVNSAGNLASSRKDFWAVRTESLHLLALHPEKPCRASKPLVFPFLVSMPSESRLLPLLHSQSAPNPRPDWSLKLNSRQPEAAALVAGQAREVGVHPKKEPLEALTWRLGAEEGEREGK